MSSLESDLAERMLDMSSLWLALHSDAGLLLAAFICLFFVTEDVFGSLSFIILVCERVVR